MGSLNFTYLINAFAVMAIGAVFMAIIAKFRPEVLGKSLLICGWIPTIIVITGIILLWIMPFKEYGGLKITIFEIFRLVLTVIINIIIVYYWSIIVNWQNNRIITAGGHDEH